MVNHFVKVHRSYRLVAAICDSGIKGKKFEEGDMVLDLSGQFFDGDGVETEDLGILLDRLEREDATFFIVGEESVEFAKGKGIVGDEGVMFVDSVPFALVLL